MQWRVHERNARVEILAVQRCHRTVRYREYRNGRVELHAIFSHTGGCSPRCLRRLLPLSPPMSYGNAQQPDGASAARAGTVSHGSRLASHCSLLYVVIAVSNRRQVDTGGSQTAGAGWYVPSARASGAGKRIDARARCSSHMPPHAHIPQANPISTPGRLPMCVWGIFFHPFQFARIGVRDRTRMKFPPPVRGERGGDCIQEEVTRAQNMRMQSQASCPG